MIINMAMPPVKSQFPAPVYIDAAFRSPIGKFGGSLRRFQAGALAAFGLRESVARATHAAPPDIVFMGHARQAGAGPNTARQAVYFSGLSETIPAITVNQACASGLTAVIQGAERIALGRARSVWAGGTESMSNTPYLIPQARFGNKMGNFPLLDGMYKDGFFCPMSDMVMGETVERFIAWELKVSRHEQDEWALLSQTRAAAATRAGQFQSELLPVPAEGKHAGLDNDEHRREETTLETLAKLPPVFDAQTGTITAGNASGITDGTAWLHLSAAKGAETMAEILDYEMVAIDPRRMGLAPIPSIRHLLARHQLKVDDIEAFEINEAFAAQIVACNRELKIAPERLNVRGGSIALGHPIGATGARITVTLLHALAGKSGALGVASLCVSGGMGVSLLVRVA